MYKETALLVIQLILDTETSKLSPEAVPIISNTIRAYKNTIYSIVYSSVKSSIVGEIWDRMFNSILYIDPASLCTEGMGKVALGITRTIEHSISSEIEEIEEIVVDSISAEIREYINATYD